jgi:hypothetical protein
MMRSCVVLLHAALAIARCVGHSVEDYSHWANVAGATVVVRHPLNSPRVVCVSIILCDFASSKVLGDVKLSTQLCISIDCDVELDDEKLNPVGRALLPVRMVEQQCLVIPQFCA